ncbi:hypothetical protein A1O3_07413 [Capronia epimyces CBS 606.96]|uniref:F-box domain-containing protein n=1 Tax=Capronia epimyces CBS 606.96 TaxID=1182542 RepID=W9XUV1_9EURO|nr:uncharacterized protein A1O3_07413 [Capronia epimyces CBS 606.96]EXJ81125.1 hypothetical protein A1O3_07413 [Capronia epimyces CBS 606.96]
MSAAVQAAGSEPVAFLSLPPEILQQIFLSSTTPSFFQLIQVNSKLFTLASQSRQVLLYHLGQVPGPKLGLDSLLIPPYDLFLIFRQRAAAHLFGANLRADCRNLRFANRGGLQSRASCIAQGSDGWSEFSLVLKNSLSVRLYSHMGQACDRIESPYADGQAKIVQVTYQGSNISVLYAWTPPEQDPADALTTQKPTLKRTPSQILGGECVDHDQVDDSVPGYVRYHLLHYNVHTNDPPVFFTIPTHRSLRDRILVPVHLAVYNRFLCAILWDLPDSIAPSAHASVLLYNTECLPRNQPGTYHATVVYPFDHDAMWKEDAGDLVNDSTGERLYTRTRPHDARRDRDLRSVHLGLRPRSIAFFREGGCLFLYAPGSVTPYTALLANDSIRRELRRRHDIVYWPHRSWTTSPLQYALSVRLRQVNATTIQGLRFTLGLPFFSRHETFSSPASQEANNDHTQPEPECLTNMLCLGTTTLPAPKTLEYDTASRDVDGPTILTIVQIRSRRPYWLCRHTEVRDHLPDLPAPPTRRARDSKTLDPDALDDLADAVFTRAQEEEDEQDVIGSGVDRNTDGLEVRVVARLWGWRPQSTTLTGVDTVSVSPRGDRIAVAQWDRVLVYALDPGPLCDDLDDDDQSSASDTGGNLDPAENVQAATTQVGAGAGDVVLAADPDDADTQTTPTPPSSLQQATQSSPQSPTAKTSAHASATFPVAAGFASFYPHVDDPFFGRLVELRPVVLKMDEGAIVHRIAWAEAASYDEQQESGADLDRCEEGPQSTTEDGRGAETDNQDMAIPTEASIGRAKTIKTPNEDDARQVDICQTSSDLQPQNSWNDSPKVDVRDPDDPVHSEVPRNCTPLPSPHVHTGRMLTQAPSSNMALNSQASVATSKPLEPDILPRKTGVDNSLSTSAADIVNLCLEGKGQDSTEPSDENVGRMSLSEPSQEGKPVASCATPNEKTGSIESQDKPAFKMKRKRPAWNELMVLTDQGVQSWNLGMWGRGKRIRRELDEIDVLQ